MHTHVTVPICAVFAAFCALVLCACGTPAFVAEPFHLTRPDAPPPDPLRETSDPQPPTAAELAESEKVVATLGPEEKRAFALLNLERTARGIPAVRLHGKLQAAAKAHSEDMAKTGLVAHAGSGNSTPFSRMDKQGYKYMTALEFVSAGFVGPEETVREWISRPAFRTLLMKRNLTEVGFAFTMNDEGYHTYWCLMLVQP